MKNVYLYDSFSYYLNNKLKCILHGLYYNNNPLQDNLINCYSVSSEFINLKNRTKFMLVNPLENEKINIKIQNKEYNLHTNNYGHFYILIELNVDKYQKIYNFDIELNKIKSNFNVHIMDYSKKIIISDIDDTIKYSNVSDKIDLVKNSLYRDHKEINKMSDMYKYIQDKYNFYYLTGSPWQLYESIIEFLKTYKFPNFYNIIMKDIKINDIFSCYNFLENTYNYKYNNICNIINNTKELIILIGDNTEWDINVYNDICLKYPNRITKIYIRKVIDDDILLKFNNTIKHKVEIFTDGENIDL